MNFENEVLRIKRGYLKEDFQFFHLKDRKSQEFEFHYHDFNKIIVFLSGKVTYIIEGKAYNLKPWDILFVSGSETHKPIIDSSEEYERIIVWVNSRFLEKHNLEDSNLLTCFELARREKFNLLRLNAELLRNVKQILVQLERAYEDGEFGSHVLRNSLFMQLMVYLNRLFLGADCRSIDDVEYDESIQNIIGYINENLSSNLSIDNIASSFFMNRYYLMHKFKEQTGYTIHSYILQKRLIMANALVRKGNNVTEVCIECGFGDYSSFVRAFKNMFGASPKKYYKALAEVDEELLRKS